MRASVKPRAKSGSRSATRRAFEIIGEGRAFVEGSGGVDFPSLVCLPIPSSFSPIDSGRPPFTRSIKVLKAKSNGIDLTMATGAWASSGGLTAFRER